MNETLGGEPGTEDGRVRSRGRQPRLPAGRSRSRGGRPGFPDGRRRRRGVVPIAAALLFFGVSACTDDPMDAPVVQVAEVVVTPDSVTFDRLGATVGATASARAADGSTLSKRINWASSDQSVVRLVTSGSLNQNAQLVATGNGTATIRATAEGVAGGVTVRVEQDIDGLRFLTDPRDALVGTSSGDVEVAVVDAAGEPVPGATGTITLDMAPGAPGALQGGPRTAPLQQGVATFADVRAAGSGSGYELVATWDPLSATSVAFDIVSDFDRLVDRLRTAGAPYPVSELSLAVASEQLTSGSEFLRELVSQVRSERSRLSEQLKRFDTAPIESQGNFVFGTTANPCWLCEALAGLGVWHSCFSRKSRPQKRFSHQLPR